MGREHRDKTKEWHALVRQVSDLLYHHDPDGMGSSVGAPSDEYDGIAVSLLRQIRDRPKGQDIGEAIRGMYPDAAQDLIDAVIDAFAGQSLW
jgi:hypothetical protein